MTKSTLTLRLSAEEAEQLEALKRLTRCKTGSEAIKYVVREYPRFVEHYRLEQDKQKTQSEQYRHCLEELNSLQEALRTIAWLIDSKK